MGTDRDEKLQAIVVEVDGILTHLRQTVDQMSELLRQDMDGENARTN